MSQLNSVHIPTSHFLKIHLNTILPSTPGSPHLSLSPRFPYQNPLHASPLPHTRYMPRPPHYSRFITRTVLGEEYRRISSSLCSFLHSAVTLGPNILLNTLFSKTLSLRSSLTVSDQSSEILIRGQIRSAHYRLPETEGTSLCSKIWLIETRWEFQFQYRSRDRRDARYGVRSSHFARIAFEVTQACRQTVLHLQCFSLVSSRASSTSDPIQSQCKTFFILTLISYRSIRILFRITGVTPLSHTEFNFFLGGGRWKINDFGHISAVAKLGFLAPRMEILNFKRLLLYIEFLFFMLLNVLNFLRT